MDHLLNATRTTRRLVLLAALVGATWATPPAWGLDNPPPGPSIDVDCTDPDTATTCRECSVDGPVFCCPGAPDPCIIRKPSPTVQLVPLPPPPPRRVLGTSRYFSR